MGGRTLGDVVLGMLQVQRATGNHCDVRLEVGPHHTWTHSAVMCALSPYISGRCDYADFSLRSPLTIQLLEEDMFDCFRCLEALVDAIYGAQPLEPHDPLHSPHLRALCKLLDPSEVLADLVCKFRPDADERRGEPEPKAEPAQAKIESPKNDDPWSDERLSDSDSSGRDSDVEERDKFFSVRTRFVLSDFKTLSGKKQSCIGCPFKCYRPSELLKHVRDTGHGGRACSLCLGRFDTGEQLDEHYALHDHPKPFFCTFCDARFERRASLAQHLPKHTMETPYTCPYCQRGFKWKHGLNSHLTVHSREKKHLCDECGFGATHAKTMRAHKLQHTGELFRCSFPGCAHTCSRKENMKKHMCTHSNDRPFVCEICGLKFTQCKSLKRHALIHSAAGLVNVCPHCPFGAIRADNLKAHILRQHSDKLASVELPYGFALTMEHADDPTDLTVLADAASSRARIENVPNASTSRSNFS